MELAKRMNGWFHASFSQGPGAARNLGGGLQGPYFKFKQKFSQLEPRETVLGGLVHGEQRSEK